MIHEIKSKKQVVATLKKRRVVAFQLNIPDPDDARSIDVPIWANAVAIDADGSIWAYESTAEDVRILDDLHCAWVDCGEVEANVQQIGLMADVADWKETKVDLRCLK